MATLYRPIEDIIRIFSFFAFSEFFFIDKILSDTSTLDDLGIGFFGFVATISRKECLERFLILVTGILPKTLYL